MTHRMEAAPFLTFRSLIRERWAIQMPLGGLSSQTYTKTVVPLRPTLSSFLMPATSLTGQFETYTRMSIWHKCGTGTCVNLGIRVNLGQARIRVARSLSTIVEIRTSHISTSRCQIERLLSAL